MKMRKLLALPLIALLLTSQPALADNYTVRDGNGSLLSMASKLLSGINYPIHLLYGLFNGTTPTPIAVDASGNVGVSVQGTPALAANAATATLQTTGNTSLSTLAATVSSNNVNVVCTSGCSGGGGGSGYSVVNATTYANTGTYSNVPAGGLVGTSAPTYTNGQASPISLTTAGAQRVDGSAVTQPISGSLTNISGTISLPSGASTSALQTTGNTSLGTIATNSATQATAANQTSQITQETAINTVLGTVTASPTANTVSDRLKTINTTLGTPMQASGGSVTANLGTLNGAATATGQTGGSQKTQIVDGSGNVIASTSNALNVTCGNCSGTSYSIANAATYANNGTYSNVPSGGLVATSAPTYTTGQASPVSLTTAGALRVDGSAATQPVSGTVACSNCSGTSYSVLNASTYANSSSFSNVPAGGLVSTSAPTYTTGQASPLNLTTGGALRTDASGTTQPVSASSLPLPTGAATAAKQPALGTAGTASSDVLTVQGIASMTALKVDGSAVTQPVSGSLTNISGTISLPTGAATSANQTTEIGSLATIATNTTNAGAPSVAADTSGNVKIIQAASSVAINVSTATTTQLVALSSGKKIYVVAANVVAGGTGNITFVYGTGTNCGTGTTSLTGAYPLTAQNGISMGSGLGPVLVVPASNALCVTTSAAVQMSGSVAIAQAN